MYKFATALICFVTFVHALPGPPKAEMSNYVTKYLVKKNKSKKSETSGIQKRKKQFYNSFCIPFSFFPLSFVFREFVSNFPLKFRFFTKNIKG